jgi:hypothetical protein
MLWAIDLHAAALAFAYWPSSNALGNALGNTLGNTLGIPANQRHLSEQISAIMDYGTAVRVVGAPVASTHARAVSLMLGLALLGIVGLVMNNEVQIGVSAKVAGATSVRLAITEKAINAKELGTLMRDLEERLPDHMVKRTLSLPSTGKDVTVDKHQCLARLLVAKKEAHKVSGTGVGGGDVSGCAKDKCLNDRCKQAPLSPLKAEEVALKVYIDSSAAFDVYQTNNPDVLSYLKDGASSCPIGTWPSELSCLELLLELRVHETKTKAQGVKVTGNDATDIIAQCDSVEEYVDIMSAHDAEKRLEKFITDKAKVEQYEAENPSISDYTDGTCPVTPAAPAAPVTPETAGAAEAPRKEAALDGAKSAEGAPVANEVCAHYKKGKLVQIVGQVHLFIPPFMSSCRCYVQMEIVYHAPTPWFVVSWPKSWAKFMYLSLPSCHGAVVICR